ncbi:MAG: hypothetical protein JSV62_12400 [Promethearchaeota archaeon]|nr:MAG: hypothetical protein JSV62_12400 [Candidatus Lokiarchaeota archaeon]
MNQEPGLRSFFVPLWLMILGIPLIFIGLLVLISTIITYAIKKGYKKDFTKIRKKLKEKFDNLSKIKKDTYRKVNHVLIFIGLLILWYVSLSIVKFYAGSIAGMIPEDTNMLLLYLRILNEPNSIINVLFSLGWFYYILFFFFYFLCLFMLANEFTRKSQHLTFPFNIFPQLYLSNEEEENYGTYLYFNIGHMFAAFVCPPMVFFTILGISSISDLVTSQIGIRFGTSKILWNKKKTWEGSLAGMIITFIICFFFIGIYWGVFFSILFLSFDIFTDKPFKLSDNLLIPIGCSLTYVFLRLFLNLNYYSFILQWF